MLRAPRSPLLRRVDLLENAFRRVTGVLVWVGVPFSVSAAVRVWTESAALPAPLRLLAALLAAAVLQGLVVLLGYAALRCLADVSEMARIRSWERALRRLR